MRDAAALLVGHHDFEAFTVADRETKTTCGTATSRSRVRRATLST
jgi:tRNA U38,U39,U40 pseudouridine synthase TruA